MEPDFDSFFRWLRARGRSEKTADVYVSHVRLAYACEDVTDRLLDEELSPNTRRLNLAALRAYARHTSDGELLALLDDMKLPPPENVSEKLPLPTEKWRELREAIEADEGLTESERACLQIICRRGLRAGAVAGLKRSQIAQSLRDDILIFSSKGRLLRYGIGPMREQLETLNNDQGQWTIVAELLCPNANKKRSIVSARRRLWRMIRVAGEQVGIPRNEMYPHRLRRTCATEFYRQTKDIKALQAYMQWTDIKTAARYVAHMDRGELDKVAENILE